VSSPTRVENGPARSEQTTLELTILMPCLNEAETVETCVRKAVGFLERSGVAGEVVVADNGSTDGSQELARAAGARVVDVPERGYGAALIAGIKAARGSYVIMGDADDSYDFTALDPFVEALRGGADLVMGNRFAGGIMPGAMPALHRYLGNPVLSFIGRRLFRTPVGDFHCGLRGFRRDAALALDLRTTGMEFASELVVKSSLSKQKIVEVPTVLRPDGRSRPPHLRSWRDGWRHLRFLLLFSPRWLFFNPGIGAMLVGGAGMTVFGSAVWTPGRGRLSEGLLIASGGLVIGGFQAAQFALFARVFAATQRLLPATSRRTSRLTSIVTLEIGLVAAVVLVLSSLGLLGYSLAISRYSDPASAVATTALRLGAIAVVLGVLGIQTALGAWFLSVLGLRRVGARGTD
jgi:glycosyltransferase involved in cell wall biosynthesis